MSNKGYDKGPLGPVPQGINALARTRKDYDEVDSRHPDYTYLK